MHRSEDEQEALEALLKAFEKDPNDTAMRAVLKDVAPMWGTLLGMVATAIPTEVSTWKVMLSPQTRPWVRGVLIGAEAAGWAHMFYARGQEAVRKEADEDDAARRARIRTPRPYKIWPSGVVHVLGLASTTLATYERFGPKRAAWKLAESVVVRSGGIWWLRKNQERFFDLNDELFRLTR